MFPLLALGACDFRNDAANNQMTLEYDRDRIENAGRTAGDVAAGVGNVAEGTARAIRNEVGDIDVDVDVRRNRPDNGQDAPKETAGEDKPKEY
jgi:hypothetical protein